MSRTPGIKQFTFAGGELSPELFGRTDLERYRQSLQTCRNFLIAPTGTAKNRPGLLYVHPTKTSAGGRLIPFVANQSQAYALEFGNNYIRFYTNGGLVEYQAATGTHTGADNVFLLIDGAAAYTVNAFVGGRLVNNTTGAYGTITANTATTITCALGFLGGGLDEQDIDTGDAYTVYMPVEVVSPWALADLPLLKGRAQQNDVMILTHPTYTPYILTRLSDIEWTIKPYDTTRPCNPPTALTHVNVWGAVDTQHPVERWEWVATTFDFNGSESLPSSPLVDALSVLYQDRVKPEFSLTAPAAGNNPAGYNWYRGRYGIYGFVGSTTIASFVDEGNVPDYSDSPPTATNPLVKIKELNDGGAQRQALFSAGLAIKVPAAEAQGDQYQFQYKLQFIGPGGVKRLQFQARPAAGAFATYADITIDEDGNGNPYTGQIALNLTQTILVDALAALAEFRIVEVSFNAHVGGFAPFLVSGSCVLTPLKVTWIESATASQQTDLPTCACFFEQRLLFGGFSKGPQAFKGSRTGDYYNFDKHEPAVDSDSLDLTVASLGLDQILEMVPLQSLLIFTTASEYVARGADGGPLTPTSYDIKPRTVYGSGTMPPLVVGNTVLFVTRQHRQIREFVHEQVSDAATARDLTVLAAHLFQDYGVTEWCYADLPFQIVWARREDGKLLGLSYSRDQNLWAWHRHDTGLNTQTPVVGSIVHLEDDEIESICSVPGVSETQVYCIVKRTILAPGGGNFDTMRYVEVFSARNHRADPQGYTFVDSALSYDGRNTNIPAAIVLTGTVVWDAGSVMTLNTVGADLFAASFVGDEFELNSIPGATPVGSVRVKILSFTNSQSVQVVAQTPVPTSLQGIATGIWGHGRNILYGAGHLRGRLVSMLVDGGTHAPVVVGDDGGIQLSPGTYGIRVQAGLGYTSEIVTMPLDAAGDEGTLRTSAKTFSGVALELDEWRGLWVGHDLNNMREIQEKQVSQGYGIISPENKLVTMAPPSGWSRSVSIAVQQRDPLPVTLQSLIALVKTGGNQ